MGALYLYAAELPDGIVKVGVTESPTIRQHSGRTRYYVYPVPSHRMYLAERAVAGWFGEALAHGREFFKGVDFENLVDIVKLHGGLQIVLDNYLKEWAESKWEARRMQNASQ